MAIKNTRFYIDQDRTEVDCLEAAGGELGVVSRRCPGNKLNQDSAVVVPISEKCLVLAVADGAGGHPQGEVASKIAVQSIHHELKNSGGVKPSQLRTAILDGFELANKKIMELGTGAATTLVVLELVENMARTYHTGDSVVMVNGQRGKEKYRTVSHSPIELGLEAGLIEEVDYSNAEYYSVVTNIIGTPKMRVEVGFPFELDPKDTVLLASDGLTDNLTYEEISAILQNSSTQAIAESLVADASGHMDKPRKEGPSKPDDLTFIVFRR